MNIEVLKKNGQLRVYKKEEVICHEDETGKYVYLLLKGKADIYKKVGQDQANKHVANILEGTVFGESSLIEGKKRNASVIAGSDNTVVLEFENRKYRLILREEPDLAFMLIRTLMNRVNLAMDKLLSVDPAYIYSCRTNDIYIMVSSLDIETFKEIVKGNRDYPLTVLKEFSEMLDSLNQRMLS
ncbi:MAG: cyclic nucleotide-binding domain-containing protein [Clostridiales bacterium]|uniref:Crp/Fnr family transcriptional regulator n=1 Tax=Anaerosporobacter sp. TaxID=1872529 RepID=UPI001DA5AA6E|nr:cyclic nucleotide-binding domain-containing protein [Anaerosporobacter sp.]MBS5935202.1 cyclic nucleotide-binding domain-containing protein [Clostridiales bacterium]